MENEQTFLGEKKLFPLLMKMAIPTMISMLIQSLYNIVDSIYVAKLGEDALAAVSLAFPLQNFVLAIAVGLGVGLCSLISRSLGEKNQEQVNNAVTHGFFYSAVHSVLFVFLGLFLVKPFLSMFATNANVLALSCEYSYIVIICSVGVIFGITVEKIFQAKGNMIIPMLLQLIGAIINIVLDPILIFNAGLGIRGAAIATVISQIFVAIVALILFFKKNKDMHVVKLKLSGDITKKIYAVGIPSAIMMAMPSILVSIINGILVGISQTAVAVFGIYYRLQTFVYLPAVGLVQGLRPIIGYNYGAKLYHRVTKTVTLSVLVVAVIMALGTVVAMGFPVSLISMFESTPNMIQIGVPALQIMSLGFIISSVSVIMACVFEALGKGMESLVVSLIRQLVLVPPLALLLIQPLGLIGVWLAFPIAESVASITAYLLYRRTKKGFV